MSRRKKVVTETKTFEVKDWPVAYFALQEVVGDQHCTLGTGYAYPQPFAAFYKDALSGEGQGYLVWTTKDGKLDALVADITIVGWTK